MGLVGLAAVVLVSMAAVGSGAEVVDLNHPVEWHPAYQSKEQWQARAKELREQVLVAAGLWPMPAKSPLNAVVHGRIERDEYTVEKVYFESVPGFFVTGNLYRPKKEGKHPAVLSPHGHWPNGRFFEDKDPEKKIAGGGEKTIEGATYPLQARCAMLARMGCVVFHYDMVGYADCTQIPQHKEGFTDAESVLRLQSTLGLQLWDSIRALDFVESLPDVDAKRIAVTGASGGGTQTLLLGVVDDRPVAFFPAVMISEDMQGGCVCENAPLLRIGTNNAELAATIAPRPLGMSAANDWTKELETRGYPEIRSIYVLFGAEDKVVAKHFPFEHNYNQVAREMMYSFMNRQLGIGWPEEQVKERAFVPVPPAELSVWDEKHPRPTTDGVKIVKEWWTKEAERQMHELGPKPEEYCRVMRVALGRMIGLSDVSEKSGRAVPVEVSVVAVGTGKGGLGDWEVRVEMPEAGPLPDPKYSAFTFGYNRSLLAERARRLAVAIRSAQADGAKRVSLAALGKYGPAGLVAWAATGELDGQVTELGDFDFKNVKNASDENFLPGALRYGGVEGISLACYVKRHAEDKNHVLEPQTGSPTIPSP